MKLGGTFVASSSGPATPALPLPVEAEKRIAAATVLAYEMDGGTIFPLTA